MELFIASRGFSNKRALEASTKVKYRHSLGTLTPLLGYGIQGSLAFGSNELFKELITYFDRKRASEPYTIMPMSQILLSGAFTGMVSTLALVTFVLYKTPADHTRIIMQKSIGKTQVYKGSIDAGLDIYRRFGLRGLYLGFNATFLR